MRRRFQYQGTFHCPVREEVPPPQPLYWFSGQPLAPPRGQLPPLTFAYPLEPTLPAPVAPDVSTYYALFPQPSAPSRTQLPPLLIPWRVIVQDVATGPVCRGNFTTAAARFNFTCLATGYTCKDASLSYDFDVECPA